jgi:hypothetical protein
LLSQADVLQVTWTNVLTGAGGVATGTNLWSASAIPLQLGSTNLIEVTASGTNYDTAYGGNTTFNTTLAVLPIINTAPSFTKGPDQVVRVGTGAQIVASWATNLSAGTALEAYQALTFLLSNDASNLFAVPPAINPAGTLTYTPAADAAGVATVTVVLRDDGGTANGGKDTSAPQTFTITVLPPNHPPVADATATHSPLLSANGVNATVVLDGSRSSDPDGDPLRYTWWEQGSATALATGVVAVVVLPVGLHSLDLIVSDGLAASTNAVSVAVLTTSQGVQRLISLVNQSGLADPKPLAASLEAALASLNRGDSVAAANQLQAFQNKVSAQVGKSDPALAQTLIAAAQQVIDALQGRGPHALASNLHTMKRRPDGKVQLGFSGLAGQVHIVEASTNLVDWEMIGVAADNGDGSFEFEDSQAVGIPNRFYRVTSP